MKKVLLFTLAIGIGLAAFSQSAVKIPNYLRDKAVKTEYKAPVKDVTHFNQGVNPTVKAYYFDPFETIVGRTFYDLWSNSMVANRLGYHEDGTMAAVWIQGLDAPNFTTDRGTGYNYYDGTAWEPVPTERIENRRCGWPSYAPWGPNGEINVAHNGVEGLEISKRENKGTGAWTQTNYLGPVGIENDPTWPRLITSGENNEYIHLFYNSYVEYEGQSTALLYSRSDDGGASWDPQDVILEGLGAAYYTEVYADAYVLASHGSTVALLISRAWYDLYMLKSDDNGENWEKTVIWENPYPFFDWDVTITDTFYCTDHSANIALDNTGKAHVVFGITRVLHDEVGTTFSLFYMTDGIGYWNEDMPTFSNDLNALSPPQYGFPTTEMIEDVNYIGWTQDVNGNGEIDFVDDIMTYRAYGISTMPSITVDNAGAIFVVWASTTETYDNFDYNFKKIWGRAYDNGAWGHFYHITEPIIHIFDESIYPTLALKSDADIHLIYQADGTPGLALDDDHDYQENRIIHSAIPKPDFYTGIEDNNELISSENVSQNYPNPFSGVTTITVDLNHTTDLSLVVTNLVGQKVFEADRGSVSAGTYFFAVDGTHLENGIYFYTIKAGNSSVTKKMIVQ